MTAKSRSKSGRVRLRPQDPFDLIRLLARSQSDPRKAVAELVQNSLDAGARHIEIVWFNEEGRRALRIWDDGRGVFPELEREEALRRIARTIGHSHKLDLTPAERRKQMVLGKYGIGLIGFWSVAEVLEMKSRVGGGRAHLLRLREDRATGDVVTSRARLVGEEDTFTEVTLRGVHEAAVSKIRPPRLQAFLANELRGQLLERDAVVRIRDRVARGRARKEFQVKPRPYLGQPVEEFRELDVPGFESARLELYLVAPDEERDGTVALSCGGTIVLDDIAEIDGVDAPRAPWSSGRFEGVIDFPDLHVSPGSRRGFSHDEPVAAFLAVLEGLERDLGVRLDEERRRRAEQRHESLARDIRRAFRSVARRLPEYDFFAVHGSSGDGAGDASDPGAAAARRSHASTPLAEGEPVGAADEVPAAPDDAPEPAEPRDDLLFPPGPLARLEVKPRSLRLPPLATRSLRARALDGDGRPCAGAVEIAWQLDGPGELDAKGPRAAYSAPDLVHEDAPEIRIRVRASQGDSRVEATVPVHVGDSPGAEGRAQGIPEPRAVTAPGEGWRSRMRDGAWEYNDAHRDYLAVCGTESRRLRYLIHLLAKEVVLRNFGRPYDDEVLERMVEVLTWLDAGNRLPRTLHLIDALPYVFRAFFAVPLSLADPDGQPVNAVHGFAGFLGRYLAEERPTHVALAFDESLTTSFRNEAYPAYKADREPAPPDLMAQIDACRELGGALGMATFAAERYEADDLIATLCERHGRQRVVVVTNDKDLAQLISERVELYDFARGERYGPADARQRFGVPPGQIPDLLGLMGDAVDSIPGVKGIGMKSAVALLEAFDDLEAIYADLERVADLPVRGARSLATKLAAGRESAFLSRELATVATDAPVNATLRDLAWRGPDPARLDPLLERLGFQSMGERLRRLGP